MKKSISLVLAVLMLLAAACTCFSASAEGKDPTFPADQSMTTATPQAADKVGTQCFYAIAGGLDKLSNLISKDYASGAFYAGIGKEDSGTVNINGLAEDNAFGAIITLKLAEGTKSSFVITVPTSGNVPNSFKVYTCDSNKFWGETEKYNQPATAATNQFTEVFAVEGLSDKWQTSKDGKFRFYEADFAKSFTANYIAIGFPKDIAGLTANSKSQYQVKAYEFGVFADKLGSTPAATTAQATTATPVTTQTPAVTTAPATTAEVTTAAATTAEATTAAVTTAAATTAEITTDAATTAEATAPAATDTPTAAPEATNAPEVTTESPKTEEKKGCGSVAAVGVCAIVAVLGTAVLRKKED